MGDLESLNLSNNNPRLGGRSFGKLQFLKGLKLVLGESITISSQQRRIFVGACFVKKKEQNLPFTLFASVSKFSIFGTVSPGLILVFLLITGMGGPQKIILGGHERKWRTKTETLLLMMWKIWEARNNLVFRNQKLDIEHIRSSMLGRWSQNR